MRGIRFGTWAGPALAVLGFLVGPALAAGDKDAVRARILALNQLTGNRAVDGEFAAIMKDRKEAKQIVAAGRLIVREKNHPLSYNAALILANLADRLKDQEAAEAFYRVCIDRATKLKSARLLSQAYFNLIALFYDNQKFEDSAKVCREFLEIRNDDPKPREYLLASDQEDEDGEPGFVREEDYNPARLDKPDILRMLIQSISKQGKYDQALKMVNNLVKASPDNWLDLQLKGWVLREAGQYKEAARVYEDVIDQITRDKRLKKDTKAPYIERYRYTLSNIYADLKRIDKATEHLKALLEKSPDNPTYNNDLGYIWADNDMNLEEAEKLIRKALEEDQKLRKQAKVKPEEDRDNGAYLDSLGWVLFKQKKYKEAKDALIKAVEDKDNQHIEIYDHLGDVYKALGERNKAVDAWQKGLKYVTGSKRDQERKTAVEKKIKALTK